MTAEVKSGMTAEQAERVATLAAAAEYGDGGAACELGDMSREGTGGLRHSPKATFRWYARSALAGYRNGQNNLSACYQHGVGCGQSYARAVHWYRRAAAQGLGIGSSNVGYCYLYGYGAAVDRSMAAEWFRKALEQGDERAAEMVKELGG